MQRYILLSTLQSTGTWWVIDALRKHPEVGGLAHTNNLMALLNGWPLRDRWAGNPHGEAIAPDGKVTLLYEHYGAVVSPFYRWYPQSAQESMMLVVPTLAPLRDPLLCMIRAWHREPPLYPYGWLLDAWINLAKKGESLQVKFWRMEPFDCDAFEAAIIGVGLDCYVNWFTSLRPELKINFTPGECDLRVDYANRNTVALEKKLPELWRRLKESQPILRPFLERYGFTNLLWWD
jgi:hypothetical protein